MFVLFYGVGYVSVVSVSLKTVVVVGLKVIDFCGLCLDAGFGLARASFKGFDIVYYD